MSMEGKDSLSKLEITLLGLVLGTNISKTSHIIVFTLFLNLSYQSGEGLTIMMWKELLIHVFLFILYLIYILHFIDIRNK